MMAAEKNSEAKSILVDQLELFPSITEFDVQRTLFLLERYVYMKMFIKEFEDHEQDLYQTDIEGETARRLSSEETHADKTSNAVIFHQKRKWIVNEYKIATSSIEQAHRLIMDEDARKAIKYRYIEGHKFMIALKFTFMSKSTFGRKLNQGIGSITDTLKLMGVLSRDWTY